MSIQGLQQDPQDTSNFYLANIYEATINPNSNISSSSPASPPPFSPPNSAVWVNALWFLSLVINLTCALLATLLQQWARRYLKLTQSPRYSPHKRARIRAFFSEGVEKCLLPWTVDALPTLIHLSLFLFFAGLVVFLCNVNLTIFKLVLSWVSLCTALYGCITCIPVFRHDSPYYTPLSLPACHIATGTLFFIYRFLRWFNWSVQRRFRTHHYLDREDSCRKRLAQGVQRAAEEDALKSPSEIDTRAFMWTFDRLDEDHELERFFSGLPAFRTSKVVDDPLPSLTEEERWKLCEALRGLLDRTFSSDLLPASIKSRRALISAKAVDPEYMFNSPILHAMLFKYQHSGPVATAIANIENTAIDSAIAQFKILRIIIRRQPFDDSWYILASNVLGFPETSLRAHAADGDSLSLLILIHITRQQFTHFKKPTWNALVVAFNLVEASKFNAKDTSPELQHKFCALWNQIVNKVQDNRDRMMAFNILARIRNVYLALHQDTNSAPTRLSTSTSDRDHILFEPSAYPLCEVPDHCPDPTRPSSTHAPLPIDETLTDALPLDNQVSFPVSTQVIGKTITESHRISTTSLSPATVCTTHGIVVHSSTSDPPPKSNTSASPLDDVAVGHTELSRTLSKDLIVRSPLSSKSTPVLDAVPPTGLLLFSGRN